MIKIGSEGLNCHVFIFLFLTKLKIVFIFIEIDLILTVFLKTKINVYLGFLTHPIQLIEIHMNLTSYDHII